MKGVIAIGLGGNLGADDEIVERFDHAVTTLGDALQRAMRRSPIYRSAPLGPVLRQPAFLNAVAVCAGPDIEPVPLMAALLDLETALGRNRAAAKAGGPRTIDLDLLLVGDWQTDIAGPVAVSVPHPRICERAFVLKPLTDVLGPSFVIPGQDKRLTELCAQTDEQSLERLPLEW